MEHENIPYIAFESAMARLERANKRLWVVVIILIVTLLGTNAGWIWYESQFEYYEITQEVEAESDNSSDLYLNTVGGDYYGREGEGYTND